MVTRRVAILAGFLLCALLFILSLSRSAVPSARAEDNFTLEGKITEKAAGKLTVSSGENMIFHVLYNDKTEIKKRDGSPGAAEDLHPGLTISVAGDLAESGEITARKIEIEAPNSEK